MNVRKRNDSLQELDLTKIYRAIEKSFNACNYPVDDDSIWDVIESLNLYDEISVEEIQDQIEENLMLYDFYKPAKAYVIYRDQQRLKRELANNEAYYKTILELVSGEPNDVSKENSNKDASQFYVTRDLFAGETSKKLYRELIMPNHIKELHDKGILHVHDVDYRIQPEMTNCELNPLNECLQNGTVINDKLIRKPHTLRTACTVASQIITTVSSSTYGGQTITLTHLAPFIRESRKKLQEKLKGHEELIEPFLNEEITNSVQTLLYQLNTMATTNGQSPFITLFLYPHEDKEYFEETLQLCEEVLKQRIEGMESPTGQKINPTFPKLVVCLTEDMFVNSRMMKYAYLCARCVCSRMVPDFLSEKNIKLIKEGCVIPPMGKLCYSPCKISLTLLRGVHKKENLFILIVY